MTPQAAVAGLLAGTTGPLGLAVSGGSDSLALLVLCAEAVAGAGPGRALHVATVDHGLRAEAAAEAALVASVCARFGLSHDVLPWAHGEVKGNLMDAARRARYRLLASWARGRGLAEVALAHTADDQAEGFLIGLSRAAGLDGLAAMRPRFTVGGIGFSRPFLDVSRRALREVLTARGQVWVEDPSNADDRFARARARKALARLGPLGISAATLARVAGNLAAERAALQAMLRDAAAALVTETAGALRIDAAGLAALPADIARRLVVAALTWLSRSDYPPRGKALARAIDAVLQGRPATLHGCRLRPGGGSVLICREPRAVRAGEPFDGRWHLGRPLAPGQAIRALAAEGLRLCPDWRATGLPREALIVSPAVWDGDRLVAAPLARPEPDWTAEIRPTFAMWIAH